MSRRTVLPAVLLVFLAAGAAARLGAQQRETVSLAQVLEAALGQGPEGRQLALEAEVSRQQYAQAKAKAGLSLRAGAGVDRSDLLVDSRSPTPWNPRTTPSDTAQASLDLVLPATSVSVGATHRITEADPLTQSTSLSLSVSQTIWDGYPGGQARASVQQAEIALQSKSLAGAADRRDLALRVTRAYYAVLSAQRTLGLRQDAVSQREQEERRARILSEGGTATALEVRQAAVNLQGAHIDLQAARSALAAARRALSLSAGWQPERDYDVGDAPDPTMPTLQTAVLVPEALSRRADLQQAGLAVRTGEIALALSKAQSSPAISASAGADYSRGWDSGTDLFTWSIAVRGSIPILDAGLAAAQAAEASAQNQVSRIAAESLAARIASDVAGKAASVRELQGRAELASSSLEVAKMQAELAELKFQQGAGTQMEALAASVAASAARAALEKARSDAQLAVLELQNAVGL